MILPSEGFESAGYTELRVCPQPRRVGGDTNPPTANESEYLSPNRLGGECGFVSGDYSGPEGDCLRYVGCLASVAFARSGEVIRLYLIDTRNTLRIAPRHVTEVAHPDLFHDCARREVVGVVPGNDSIETQILEPKGK